MNCGNAITTDVQPVVKKCNLPVTTSFRYRRVVAIGLRTSSHFVNLVIVENGAILLITVVSKSATNLHESLMS